MTFKEYIESLQVIAYDDIIKMIQNQNEPCSIEFKTKRRMAVVVDTFDMQHQPKGSFLFSDQDENMICEGLYNTLINSGLDIEFEYYQGIGPNLCCKINGSYIHFPEERCLEWLNTKIEEERSKGNDPAGYIF